MKIISITCETCEKEYKGNLGNYGKMICSGEEGGGDGTIISHWEGLPECKTKLRIVLDAANSPIREGEIKDKPSKNDKKWIRSIRKNLDSGHYSRVSHKLGSVIANLIIALEDEWGIE